MKVAAVACDDWKVPVFEGVLTEQGYEFETRPGLTKDTRIIKVKYHAKALSRLTWVIQRCRNKAAELKN